MGGCPRYIATLKRKEEIKFAFLFRSMLRQRRTFHIAVMTTNGKFYEHSLRIQYQRITKLTGTKIKRIFSGYLLTEYSEVMIDDDFGCFEPIYFYFDFVHQHVPFRRRQVNTQQIVRRVCTYHRCVSKNRKASQITAYDLKRLWRWLIDHKKCPWITQEYDYQLQKYGQGRARDRMIVRLAMYYAFISLHFREKNERVDARRAARLQQQAEMQAEESSDDQSLGSTLSSDEI